MICVSNELRECDKVLSERGFIMHVHYRSQQT